MYGSRSPHLLERHALTSRGCHTVYTWGVLSALIPQNVSQLPPKRGVPAEQQPLFADLKVLACREHYNPLVRYALMADGKQIHSAIYPGSFGGDIFSEQTQVNIRKHTLESGCFVVNATAWLDADQQAEIMRDTGCPIGPISSGCFTAIVTPRKVS
jgi:predicted amidohydrolase